MLATHFGDPDAVPNNRCEICSFCVDGKTPSFDPSFSGVPDPVKVKAILAACTMRDDPRLLARFAFGTFLRQLIDTEAKPTSP